MLINPSRQEFYLWKYIFEIRNKRIELSVFIYHTKRNGSRGFANSRDCMKEPVMQQVKGGNFAPSTHVKKVWNMYLKKSLKILKI